MSPGGDLAGNAGSCCVHLASHTTQLERGSPSLHKKTKQIKKMFQLESRRPSLHNKKFLSGRTCDQMVILLVMWGDGDGDAGDT